MQVSTIKVKREGGRGYRLINAYDFNPEVHEPADAEAEAIAKDIEENGPPPIPTEAPWGGVAVDSRKNPSGTFSEPTPTDVRYSNKDATEFERNHGAQVGKSAAEMRKAAGMPDVPGGIVGPVLIPGKWRKLSFDELKKLAEKLTGQSDLSIKQSRRVIADEIHRRLDDGRDPEDGMTDDERDELEGKAKPTDNGDDPSGLKKHADLDAFLEDHNIEAPEDWDTMKIAEKQAWLADNYEVPN